MENNKSFYVMLEVNRIIISPTQANQLWHFSSKCHFRFFPKRATVAKYICSYRLTIGYNKVRQTNKKRQIDDISFSRKSWSTII